MYYNLTTEQMEKLHEQSARFNEAWTEEEKQAVCRLFQVGKRVDEIAQMQGRTVNAIRIKLVQAGEIAPNLSRRGQPWTEQEEERLGRFHSQGYPVAGCARLLGRRRKEAEDKLIETGLLAPKEKSEARNADYPNAYEPWSQEELRQLHAELSGYRETLTAMAAIAASHGRSIGSIISRAAKDGLCDAIAALPCFAATTR
jgi:predicted transcriptional regulator